MLNLIVPTEKNNYKPYLLRNTALVVYTVFLLLFNSFSGILGLDKTYASSISQTNIVGLTNAQRERYGLRDLKVNSKLSSAALAKANNMFKEQYWSHYGPNGESPWDFIKESGYSYVYAGENLAKGFRSAEGVVEAWMASPKHRENVLSGNFKEIGVAVVSGSLLGEDVILVVQMFGNTTSDVSASPKPDVDVTQTEKGDTMSIKITSPKEDAILNDANVDIKGTVTNGEGGYTVEMLEGIKSMGGFESNGKFWTWDKQSDWSEGEHIVTARLANNTKQKDTVNFTIDSTGPTIVNFEVSNNNGVWAITGKIDDANGSVNIVSGDTNRSFVVNDSGEFSGEIDSVLVSSKVDLLCTDTLGNLTQKDVSTYFVSEQGGSVLSTFINFFNSIDKKEAVNGIFLGFVFVLIFVEVYTYWKRKMLAKHGGNLFTLAFWWILMGVGVFSGFSGVIG